MLTSSREEGDLFETNRRGLNGRIAKLVDFGQFPESPSARVSWPLLNGPPTSA